MVIQQNYNVNKPFTRMLKVFTISTLSSEDNELKSILYAFCWDVPAKARVWKTWFPRQQYSEDGFGEATGS